MTDAIQNQEGDVGVEGGSCNSQQPVEFPPPEGFTVQWVLRLAEKLDEASRGQLGHLSSVLPASSLCAILAAATLLVNTEPTTLDIRPTLEGQTVTVVGDTHGQFYDVFKPLFEAAGYPSEQSLYIFNGDFVDRGSCGIELLTLLACWKLALPHAVWLLRGNHETTTCTLIYGFHAELGAKYGKKQQKEVYRACKKLFAALPLAAVVADATLILHGGLFRKPQRVSSAKRKRGRKGVPTHLPAGGQLQVGSMADLRASSKGGFDPSGAGGTVVAADVLWSDPVMTPGLEHNVSRGIGCTFGPDVTQEFLEENGLKLVIRSHEGPDARDERDDGMLPMTAGYTCDHDTPSGKLMTVFSAPDYPQHQVGEERYNNLGAVLVLSAPDYATPAIKQYSALQPRPEAPCYYSLELPDSDEEMELIGCRSDVSGASGASTATGDAASDSDGPGNLESTSQIALQAAAVENGPAESALSREATGHADDSGAAVTAEEPPAQPSSCGGAATAQVEPAAELLPGNKEGNRRRRGCGVANEAEAQADAAAGHLNEVEALNRSGLRVDHEGGVSLESSDPCSVDKLGRSDPQTI